MKQFLEHTVRSTEIDAIGHVNNAKYLEYMEWSRFDWLIQLGLNLDELRRRAIMPVMVSIQINYRKELRMGERIKINTKPVRLGGKSFVLRHEIENEAGDVVCDAEVIMVVIDAKLRRSVEIPEEFTQVFQNLLQSEDKAPL